MKKTISSIIIIILFIITVAGITIYRSNLPQNEAPSVPETATTTTSVLDAKNATYTVSGEVFTLKNGVASRDTSPSSATKNTLQLFGEPVYGDLNKDGVNDAALMLVHNPGGSGTFYYAVLILSKNNTYIPTLPLLLGDRIAPQNIAIESGHAVYNYAERKAGEPMTAQPSIGKSLYVYYDPATGEIGELAKDFEGEASPSVMKLDMKKWEWVKTEMSDGTVITPKKKGAFSITFGKNGVASISTDCNSANGSYVVQKNLLTFGQLASTKMYCEGSQEDSFIKSINTIASYFFTSKGELILEIKMDSGSMIFK